MASNEIKITVMSVNGRNHKIYVPPDCPVSYLKDKIVNVLLGKGKCAECLNEMMQLNRNGCYDLPMHGSDISLYGIKNGSVIYVKWRVFGGGLAHVWYDNGAMQVGGPKQRQSNIQTAEFSISTFHVSCRSDRIVGQNMMGIVLYLCDNKQLFYLNGMKCRSGYILLVNSDKIKNIQTKDATMHSKAFKYFIGKDLKNMNVVGGGFAIKNGVVVFRSGTFNSATTKFHDGKREMHIMEEQCIEAAINNWKKNIQNTKVASIYNNGACYHHGFY